MIAAWSFDRIDWEEVGSAILDRGLVVIITVVLAVAFAILLRRLVPRVVTWAVEMQHDVDDPSALEEMKHRADTVGHVFIRAADIVLFFGTVIIILSEMGANIAPFLAGAGVAGIAIGFGAQSLIRDFLAGIFILLENQYHKGDVVEIAGIGGAVEDVSLRRTLLRDLDGTLHSVPNGEIRVASNRTRSWARVNIDIGVSYGEDLSHARTVIDGVGEELAADPEWRDRIIEAPKLLRLNRFLDSSMELKVLGKTRPGAQWDVSGELRRRLKLAFDREGIEIPFPQRVIHQRPLDREDPAPGSAPSPDEAPE